MGINRVVISGNLTRDAELRTTQSGLSILSMGVAVNERHKNSATGEWEDRPNYVDCALFGSRGEKLQPYLRKGCKVAVEGRLRYSSWESGGERRSKLDVIVDEIEFMSRRDGGAQAASAAPAAATAETVPHGYGAASGGVPAEVAGIQGVMYDEDIPF